MTNLPGECLKRDMVKGFRPFFEAREDEKKLRENEWTGVNWNWVDRNKNPVYFSS